MIKFFKKIIIDNYYNMHSGRGLEISSLNCRKLIELTHGIYGFWKGYPKVIEELISEAIEKKYKGIEAFDYVNLNYKPRLLESESKILGEEVIVMPFL